MNIRYAKYDDLKKIKELVSEGLRDFGFSYQKETSEADLEDIESEYFKNDGTFLVMETEEALIVATGAIANMGSEVFKIRKMYVSKDFRRLGYGRILLTELIKFAVVGGAKRIVLETSSKMVAAIELYKSMDFKPTDLLPSSPRCNITMIKEL